MKARTILTMLMCISFFGAFAGQASADIPPYRPPQSRPAEISPGPALVIKRNFGAPDAVLTIPRKMLPGEAGAKPKADAGRFSPTQTLVAGLAMTAALTLGGLHLARRRGKLAMGTWVAAAGLVAGGIGSIAMANLAPRPLVREQPIVIDGKVNWKPGALGLRKIPLTIKIVEEGDVAELLVETALLEPQPGAKPPVVKPEGGEPPAAPNAPAPKAPAPGSPSR